MRTFVIVHLGALAGAKVCLAGMWVQAEHHVFDIINSSQFPNVARRSHTITFFPKHNSNHPIYRIGFNVYSAMHVGQCLVLAVTCH